MNLCRNTAVVVGFFLAFTLSLPLTVGAVEYPSAIGPQSVVVLTVELSDEKPRYYPPVSQVEGLIFGMVNDYYQEVSYGQMFFEGYVTRKFYQIGSMDYYEGRGSPTGGQNVHIVADAILAADEDVDYSAYRHVIVVLIIPRRVGNWISCPEVYKYPYNDLWVETNDGVTVESAILLQGSTTAIWGWVHIRPLHTCNKALGMAFGLPDELSYLGLPRVSNHLSGFHMSAWEKMMLGWIPPEQVLEVPLETTTRVTLDPIEQNTTGTLAVKILKTPESYWLVEARRPIGYDAYYPTLAGPDSPANVMGHPPIEGVQITHVIQPISTGPPIWRGLWIVSEGPPLGNGPNDAAIFVDEEENLLIAVVEEVGLSYVVEITTADRETEIRKLLEQRPRFVVTDLDINPTRVGVRQPVTISVNVTNVGNQEGSCSLNLETQYGARWYNHGYYVETNRVTLIGGESKIVTFTLVPEDLGLWLVRVAGLQGEFMVHWTPVAVPVSAVVVNFPDSALEAAIREEIGAPAGDIHDTDLVGLTSLNADNRGIADLEGIQHCVDLMELRLSVNQIVDISPLSGLTNLTMLELYDNQIVNISALSGLTNLTELYVGSIQVVRTSALSGLTTLAWFYPEGNQIVDISALSGLTNLETLSLGGIEIVDISPLSDLTNLTELRLGRNEIVDISALSGLTNLTRLALYGNRIVDISALSGLTNLTRLALGDNEIVDISPLSSLTNLTMLYLNENQIVHIGPLAGLTTLAELDLGGIQIVDISPLADLTTLTELNLAYNQIVDISPLSGLTNLAWLDLLWNDIVDISPLAGLTNLAWLELGINKIVDISAVSHLTNLTVLRLDDNQIVDVSALSGLTNLTDLYLGINEIIDISALSGLTKLTELDLGFNQIVDIQALVDNSGLGAGNLMIIHCNSINLTPGSPSMLDIEALLGRGVDVIY